MPEMSDSTTDLGAIDSPAAANTTGASVISGGLWNSLNQTLPQGFALAISVAAARFLGPDGMGRQSFIAFTMISITQLTSEGLKESLMRSVGEALGADRPGEVRGLVRWALPILLLGGLAGGAVLILAGQLGASPAAAWVLAGVECVLVTAQGAPWAALVGAQKWRQASTVGLLTTMIGVPVTVLVLALGGESPACSPSRRPVPQWRWSRSRCLREGRCARFRPASSPPPICAGARAAMRCSRR